MTSWMEERDRLVAQTEAFVQQVAAARPKVPAKPMLETTPTDDVKVGLPAPPAAVKVAPATPPAAAMPPSAVVATPVPSLKPVASERTDILQRVAAFRARQARMNDEREAYNETMQAKIRAELGNEADGSGL
ncbi:MAG: hypothetical protein JWQ94_4009 [Tardiphaga sp.]|jgi:hypothetical protein|nr:hypothetical protein [Tardiphaga sp.]